MNLFAPPISPVLQRKRRSHGFTMIEMLVSVTILILLMSIIFEIIQMTSQSYKQTSQGTGTMQQARVAFERMTRNISQATLNTYYSYYYVLGVPTYYYRQSELQFVSGNGPIAGGSFISGATQVTHGIFFQAPLGVTTTTNANTYGNLNSLLNACGYFVIYSQDTFRPSFLSSTTNKSEYRYRLMELLQPTEYLSVYSSNSSGSPNGAPTTTGSLPGWISGSIQSLTSAQTAPNITVRPLANNIVALIIMPEQFVASGTTTYGEANTSPLYSSPDISSSSPSQATYLYDSAYNAQNQSGSAQYLTGNQLPPLVKVVMVAIDETSAIRLAALNPGASITSPPDLGNLPTSSPQLFTNPTQLFTNNGTEGDLQKLEDKLTALRLNYYVFQTDVIIRGAKWTAF